MTKSPEHDSGSEQPIPQGPPGQGQGPSGTSGERSSPLEELADLLGRLVAERWWSEWFRRHSAEVPPDESNRDVSSSDPSES